MRRRPPRVPDGARGLLPVALRVGPCIEVWVDPAGPSPGCAGVEQRQRWAATSAWRRYGLAAREWAATQPDPAVALAGLGTSRAPWSWSFLAGTGRLGEHLESLGLSGADMHWLVAAVACPDPLVASEG